jgi:Pyruvate/2-oxoacid:ferredoxin oxidoreductase delta subunit
MNVAADCCSQRHSSCYVQLHNSTAYLLYKYCTNCTVCNWTVFIVITHKLVLHVQLHNSTAYLLYKYCTYCAVCNLTVLRVITYTLLLHVQLHNSTAHLPYKYCTICTVCNWTLLTLIRQKLLLHFQLHNSTHTVKLLSSEVQCCRLIDVVCLYTNNHIQRLDSSKKFSWLLTHYQNLTVLLNTRLIASQGLFTLSVTFPFRRGTSPFSKIFSCVI